MSQSVKFALALVLLWLAFACFFTAFHPGGLQIGDQPAKNPSDVIKFMVNRAANPPGEAGKTA